MPSDTFFFFFFLAQSLQVCSVLAEGCRSVNGVSPKTDQKGRGQDLAVFYEIQFDTCISNI